MRATRLGICQGTHAALEHLLDVLCWSTSHGNLLPTRSTLSYSPPTMRASPEPLQVPSEVLVSLPLMAPALQLLLPCQWTRGCPGNMIYLCPLACTQTLMCDVQLSFLTLIWPISALISPSACIELPVATTGALTNLWQYMLKLLFPATWY